MLTGRAAVIVLSEAETAALARQLGEAIRLGYTARGNLPPHLLQRVARVVSEGLQGPADVQVSNMAGPYEAAPGRSLPSSRQPDSTLSTDEAARLGKVHPRTIRKWIRRGRVQARRGPRGELRVDIASLAAWLDGRRTEHDDDKAA